MVRFAFLVNNDGYKKYTYLAAKNAGASVPHIGHSLKFFAIHNAEPLNRYFELPFKWIWFKKVVDETKFKKNDEVVFILYESFHMSFSRKLIVHYKRKYHNSKFLFFFTNPVGEYNSKRLNIIKDLVDAVYTFNKEDSEKFGYTFLEVDPLLLPVLNYKKTETDLFFVGSNKGRLDILLGLYEKLSPKGIICDFWVTDVDREKQKYNDVIHYNKRLTYEEVLQHDANTKCIVEILQDGKSYSSIRTIEAFSYRKKLLTMSESVKDRSFYDPEIICVFKEPEDISEDFICNKVDLNRFIDKDFYSFNAFKEFIMKSIADNNKYNKRSLDNLFSKGLFQVIRSDLAKLNQPSFFNGVKYYIFPKGTVFRFDVWFRIVQWSRLKKIRKYTLGFIAYYIMRHYEYKYGIHVNPNIYVGKGLHIMHGDGVHLNCKYIGDNFTVFQGVTLGAKHGEIPTVLDDVTVYTNSVVCGGITLNNGVVVGAQSYVDKDVDENQYIAGVPAHVITKSFQ